MAADPSQSRDRLLYQVAAELTSSLDLDEVLRRLIDRAIQLLNASRGFVVLVDAVSGQMQIKVARGESEEDRRQQFLGSRTVIEDVVSQGRAVVTTDASVDERFKGQQSVILHSLRSIIAAPLVVKATVVGAIYLDNPWRAGIFEEADKDFLQALADLAAIAIDNARLYTELKTNFEHAEFLRRTFERYVNKQVTDWVLADPNRDQVFLPGQRLQVTMLASDIAGFSALSRELEAEALVDFLNGYFSQMVDIVIAHGGNVDKFQGDGLLVAFGAPVPMTDSAQRAVAAAQDMRTAIQRMNDLRRQQGQLPIEVGIGIDTGFVVAGNVGSERRLEYTLIGVPVNNAAFLSKLRPAGLLISQGTYQALLGAVAVEARPPIVLKGARSAVPIYAVTGSG